MNHMKQVIVKLTGPNHQTFSTLRNLLLHNKRRANMMMFRHVQLFRGDILQVIVARCMRCSKFELFGLCGLFGSFSVSIGNIFSKVGTCGSTGGIQNDEFETNCGFRHCGRSASTIFFKK